MSTLKSTLESLASQFAMSILNALRSASIEEVMGVTGARASAAVVSASAPAAAAPAKRGAGRPKKAAAAAVPAPVAPAPAAAPKKRGRPAGSGNKTKAAAAPKAVAAPKAKKTAPGRLARRSLEDIGSVVESIVALLQSYPDGLRAEQIRVALGLEAKELPRPLADGVAAGTLTKTGQKRATTYFLAGGKSKKRGR